jgi:rhamnosyltransferase
VGQSVCAVVVTYHPAQMLQDNLARLTGQVSQVVVVDNGTTGEAASLISEAGLLAGVQVIRNRENLGIAAALNTGIRAAIDSGYPWVATFDQDSTVTDGFIDTLFAGFEACPFKSRVALVSPAHHDSTGAWEQGRQGLSAPPFEQVITAMTSGSLIRTDVFSTVGFYDESMFIDYVDYDFCLRLRRNGWRTISIPAACLVHRLGAAEQHSLFGLKFTTRSHSAWRRYYIMRNRILVYRRYASSAPWWCLRDFGWIFLELLKIIFLEQDKMAKLHNLTLGLYHGLAGKTGQLQRAKP